MREVVRIAKWRRATRGVERYHPSNVGFWPLAARLFARRPPTTSQGSFVAVILVHQRPANVDLQVRAALHASAVGEVIVSCNNPAVRLEKWLSVSSPRLRVLHEAGRNQTRRYALALASGADRFVLPDDDVLFSPGALDEFCAYLPPDAEFPIGMAGQRLGASGAWESGITAPGDEVDVLNRAYLCTRTHAEAVFRNAARLGWSEEETFTNPADDVLLSFSGSSAPRLAELRHVNCISHTHPGISTFLQRDFHDARAQWVETLRAELDRAPARRDLGACGAASPPASSVARAVSVVAQPLRARFYTGQNVRSIGLLPPPVRRAAGLDDYAAMVTQRAQIGHAPAPLAGFVHIDARRSAPGVTLRSQPWAPKLNHYFATEVVAFGVLDAMAPALVPMALASWRSMIATGGRLVVGVRDGSARLAARDAEVGARSWASQLPSGSTVLESPLQLTDAPNATTLWDAERIGDAIVAQGFEIVATVTDGSDIERALGVAPWDVPTSEGPRTLLPVPAALNGAAEIVVVARAR